VTDRGVLGKPPGGQQCVPGGRRAPCRSRAAGAAGGQPGRLGPCRRRGAVGVRRRIGAAGRSCPELRGCAGCSGGYRVRRRAGRGVPASSGRGEGAFCGTLGAVVLGRFSSLFVSLLKYSFYTYLFHLLSFKNYSLHFSSALAV